MLFAPDPFFASEKAGGPARVALGPHFHLRGANMGIAKCQLCGEELPAAELSEHRRDKHPEYWSEIHSKGGKSRAKTGTPAGAVTGVSVATAAGAPAGPKQVPAELAENRSRQPKTEAKTAGPKEEQQVKGRFITKVVDISGDILVLYWLAKAAFPDYEATEREWIADCIRQSYAEHSEELGLNKLFDKTCEAFPVGAV